jgi:hypothetical protein
MKHYILQKLFQRKSCPRWMALSVVVLNMLFSTNLSAQITQRGSSTTASAATTNGTTITISKPTGVVAGDVLLFSVVQNETDNDNGGLASPTLSGWTLVKDILIRSDGTGNGNNAWFGSIYYRVADGTEGTSFTFAMNSRCDMAIGSMVAFSGVACNALKPDGSAGGPFDIVPGTFNNANSATATATAVTVGNNNSAVIMFAMCNNDRTYSGWSNSQAELFDNITADGDDASVGAAWLSSVNSGSTGTRTVTLSASDRSSAILLVLRRATNMTVGNASSTPTLCVNTALTNITHATTLATGIGTPTGLPSGVNAAWASNTITISGTPTASGTFTYSIPLTGGCGSVVATGTIVVNPRPTSVTATASPTAICSGGSVSLTSSATSNSATATTLLSQNFNGTPTGWTTTNASTGGTLANAAWTLRPNGSVVCSTCNTPETLNSNDASQFYLSNSDSQGSGGTTATTLQSPSFSTLGMSAASLTFYQYYRDYDATDSAIVEISTNGTSWTVLNTYTSTQGTRNGFVLVTTSLNSYLGQANVFIRFRYAAVWGYYWAIDNVTVTSTPVTPAISYAWTSTPSGFTSSTQNPTGVTPTVATTYTISVTNNFGCSASETSESVAVNALPTVNAGTAFTKTCVANTSGAAIGEAAEAGHTYSWSPTTGLSSSTASNPTANPTTTTTYTVTKTNTASGCTATGTVIVTVNNSAISVNAGTAFTKTCVANTSGAAIGEAAVAGHTYSWSPSTGLSSTTAGNPTANPTTTTTYTVTKTNTASGCTATGTVIVTVDNQAPTVTTSGNLSICVGSSATITASGATSYVWDNSLGTASSVSVSPSTTTTYTVTGTAANGCTNTAEATITVFPIQTVSVSIAASQTTICSGTSVTFTATPTNGGTNPAYQWKVDGSNVGSNSPTFTSSTLGNGNVVRCVMTSNATVCISGSPATSNAVTMTVNPNLPASVSVGASATSICVGTSVTFTATPTNGGTTPSYQWKLNGSNVGTNSATYTSSALADGNTVSVVMTSNASPCLTGSPATSNSISMIVAPTTVGGTISGGGIRVCQGTAPADLTLAGHIGTVVRWEKSSDGSFTNPVSIASTSAVLTGAALGIVSDTTYIRAVVQSGVCSIAYSETTLLTVVSTTWNGSAWTNGEPNSTTTAIITGNFTPTADLYACSLTVSNQAVVTIPSAVDVILSGALTVEPLSSFTLEHDSNLTQTISASNAVNTGTIIVKEATPKLKRQDYAMFSSPVTGQQLQSFSPATLSSRFYTYSPATNLYTLVPSPSTTNFATGSGYLIRTPNNFPATPTVWTANYVGTPFNGTLTLPVTNGTYNAVGNPYPSTIDADMFFDANGITEALYFYRKTNGVNTSAYATYTKGGGVSSSGQSEGNGNSNDPNSLAPDGNIAVGQGFIVKATSNTVTFNNAMRLNSGAGVQLRASVERHRVWLNMTNPAGFFSQTLVAYMTGATNGVDAAIDGRYFNDNQTALTTIVNGQEFAIQGRSLPFENLDVVSIGFKTEFATTYTISIEKVDGLFSAGQAVYLKDNLTNTYTNLRLGSYTFNSVAGVFNSRFELRFAALPTFYQDADGDSFGSAFNTIEAETAPVGYVANSSDCDDALATVNVNATEVLGNGIDDNCDGITDEATYPASGLISTSCGVTLTNLSNALYAQQLTTYTAQNGPIQGYRFAVSDGQNTRIYDSAVSNFSLLNLPGGATYATTYSVRVSVKLAGYWRPYGATCSVTTPAVPNSTSIVHPSCGSVMSSFWDSVFCNRVAGATGYRFRVRNGATIVGSYDSTINRFSFTNIGISNFAFGVTYSIDVLLKFGNTWRPDTEYGSVCTLTSPAAPPSSRIVSPLCGSTIASYWTAIYAQQVTGAQGYRFEVSTGGQSYTFDSAVGRFNLRNVVGLPLTANTTYSIRVSVLYNAVYYDYGSECSVTTAAVVSRIADTTSAESASESAERQIGSDPVFVPIAYPNPFVDTFRIAMPEERGDIIHLLIYDLGGKLITKEDVFATDMESYQFGSSLQSGDYLLVISQGSSIKSMHINKR